jgi:hypothetical protein
VKWLCNKRGKKSCISSYRTIPLLTERYVWESDFFNSSSTLADEHFGCKKNQYIKICSVQEIIFYMLLIIKCMVENISLTHSPPSLMQLRNVHNLYLIWNNIKITSVATCYMFPCNYIIAVHTIMCLFSSVFYVKYVWLRIKVSLHSVLFSFCSVHVCAPFLCIFSLVGHMSLVAIDVILMLY